MLLNNEYIGSVIVRIQAMIVMMIIQGTFLMGIQAML